MKERGASGSYHLGPEIACGGTSRLNLGERRQANGWRRPVLIKRLLPPFQDTPDYLELLRGEAAILGALSHPNIVQIYDFAEIAGEPCLILEPVQGLDLARLLGELRRRRQPLPGQAALYLLLQLSQALHYLHQEDPRRHKAAILHRDLSPDNILLTWEGHLKLADFGISLPVNQTTAAGAAPIWGKRRYASPEQQAGQALDETSDLYSLGRLAEELARATEEAPERALLQRLAGMAAAAEPSRRCRAETVGQTILAEYPAVAGTGARQWQRLLQALYPEGIRPLTETAGEKTRRWIATRILSGRHCHSRRLAVPALVSFLVAAAWPVSLGWKAPPGSPAAPPAAPGTVAGPAAGLRRESPAAVPASSLQLNSTPWSYIYINGKRFGPTPLSQVNLPPGEYRVSFHSPNYPLVRQRTVQLAPGQHLTLHERFPAAPEKRWPL